MVLTARTEQDLAEIKRIDQEIKTLREQQKKIWLGCAHENYELTATETMAFEYEPIRECVVCHKPVPGITDEERRQVVTEFYADIDVEITEEKIEQKLKGWNLL